MGVIDDYLAKKKLEAQQLVEQVQPMAQGIIQAGQQAINPYLFKAAEQGNEVYKGINQGISTGAAYGGKAIQGVQNMYNDTKDLLTGEYGVSPNTAEKEALRKLEEEEKAKK